MSNMTPFDFNGTNVRVLIREGEPWFIAADLCAVLDIRNSRDALARLDDDEKGVATTDTPGGPQKVAIVNESGMYSLVLTSRKTEAKVFKKWVTKEVLPSIRKTGGYGHVQDKLANLTRVEMARFIYDAELKRAELEPKAESFDKWQAATNTYSSREVAKMLKTRGLDVGGNISLYRILDAPRIAGGMAGSSSTDCVNACRTRSTLTKAW